MFAESDFDEEIRRSDALFREVGECTHDGVGITRASYGKGEQLAHERIAREARESGLEVTTDAALNLRMTLPGRDRTQAILVGSHLDSAPRGGNYDGLAGVLGGLACARLLAAARRSLDSDFTVMAIRGEENAWFGAQHVGSRAALGRLSTEALDGAKRIDTGLSLGEHMTAAGADLAPIRARRPLLASDSIRAFLELHIEQGPVLDERGEALGIVTGIRGTLRCREARCLGEQGHAGVVPRRLRHDAVLAAAELATRIDGWWEGREAEGEDLVITIGRFATNPATHGITTIPAEVAFCIDARSHSATTLQRLWAEVGTMAHQIESRRGVSFRFAPIAVDEPVAMDSGLQTVIHSSAHELGLDLVPIASGAGHDAGDFASAGVPTAMIFLRNSHGSHNPAEAMAIRDYAKGVRLLARTIERLGGLVP